MRKRVAILSVVVILFAVTILNIITHNISVKNSKVNINISVYDKEGAEIYNKSIDTHQEFLIDVINEITELEVITEDSKYGKYIISIMKLEQDDKYFWSYYIDGNYASVGVSKCKVEKGKNYSFKMEELYY